MKDLIFKSAFSPQYAKVNKEAGFCNVQKENMMRSQLMFLLFLQDYMLISYHIGRHFINHFIKIPSKMVEIFLDL